LLFHFHFSFQSPHLGFHFRSDLQFRIFTSWLSPCIRATSDLPEAQASPERLRKLVLSIRVQRTTSWVCARLPKTGWWVYWDAGPLLTDQGQQPHSRIEEGLSRAGILGIDGSGWHKVGWKSAANVGG
jgi:hypothetical protein